MSNSIYNEELYNPYQKDRFLKNLTRNTKITYERVLTRASSLEQYYKKDLYNFNIREIEQLLSYLNPKTLGSCQVSVSVIQAYIRWAIEQGLRTDNTSPLDVMADNVFFLKFIDKTNILLFSKEQIDDITGGLVNFIDAALVRCIFEGVLGKGYSEILNLKIGDIDEVKNELTLSNDVSNTEKSTRVLKLHDDSNLIRLLIKAFEQKTYHKNNGNPSPNTKAETIALVDNNFIFRSATLNLKYADRAHPHLVLRKLSLISEWFGYPYFNAVNLRSSGMLYELYRLYVSYGKLDKDQFDIVGERFNISKTKGYYSLARQKKEFLNLDVLKEIYEVE
ncbi:phage lytic cycle repressor MrpR family protein [Paenibacillus tianjinensis]|uniref:Uncharacterized protein n=1 Tax=Paenibacillus tianjinensis TaxID=2810347 RepID=A0ABX7L7I0_9BACL|nr:hypothetical protein [Paenibacillus tianjinensis]QSF43286.1 hypothetical protein JRJ22_18640 [Paenibacillus tianjinensis]